MPSSVQKWGNSLGVRIPKAVAQQANLHEGTTVEFNTAGGVLTIRAKRRRKYTLAQLLAKTKGPSPHRRLAHDGPIGRELI